jgi:chromosomal replication initiation ATPase DnaA
MAPVPRQLVFDLAHRPALGAEDFIVSSSNQAAVDAIDLWPGWSHFGLTLVGPAQCGKTHLANVWRLRSNAHSVAAADLSEQVVAALDCDQSLLVEDLDQGIGCPRTLFHLMNLAREHRRTILFTARVSPGEIDVILPDLRSRLRALPVVMIERPDEALLRTVLIKHFADRQLAVDPQLISYIAVRIERSMAAAEEIVAETDRLALATHRRVTRPLVAQALAGLGWAGETEA